MDGAADALLPSAYSPGAHSNHSAYPNPTPYPYHYPNPNPDPTAEPKQDAVKLINKLVSKVHPDKLQGKEKETIKAGEAATQTLNVLKTQTRARPYSTQGTGIRPRPSTQVMGLPNPNPTPAQTPTLT